MNENKFVFKFESISSRGPYHGKRAESSLRSLSSPSGVIVEYHVLRTLEEQGFTFNVERDNKSLFDPEKLFLALKKYDGHSGLHLDEKVFNQAFDLTLKCFGGEKLLRPLKTKESLYQAVKLEKSSGAPLFTSKGEAFEKDYQRMLRHISGERAAEPCVSYHRIQHGVEGPKTRLVWGYPLHMTLLEAKYARPLIDYFLKCRTPMAFGLHRHELSSRMISIVNSGVRYGFDFTGYDASIHPKLLDSAFNVLKTHFEEVEDEEWNRMVHYFIHTPIVMPDKQMYVVHQGVPSGSFFTQLIDSIVNYLAVQYGMIRLFGKPALPDKILVLGDDGLVGLDEYMPISKWATIFKEIGLNLNPKKSQITRFGENVGFLGHFWDRGIVNRDLDEIAKRMAFPEKHVKIEDARMRIVTRVLAFGSDALNAHLIISRWSRYKGPDITGIYFRDTLNEPILGWREVTKGDRDMYKFPHEALNRAFIGILT